MEEMHGFKLSNKRLIVKDWWNVYKEDVVFPNGNKLVAMYGEQRSGVIVLGLTHNQEVVMIEEFRICLRKKILGLPAGIVDDGETPAEAAARELQEEAGYKPKKVVHLASMYPTVGMIKFVSNVFFATELEHVGQNLDDCEDIKVKLVPLKEFEDIIKKGNIEGGMMLAYYIAKDKGLL